MAIKKPEKIKYKWVDADNPNPFASALNGLLACPFCGGKAIKCDCEDEECNYIICKECGVEAVWCDSDYEINKLSWNMRAG